MTTTTVDYLDRLVLSGTFVEFYDPHATRFPLPTYPYHWAPAGLATRRQLRAAGLRPDGQEVSAQILWRRGKRMAYLYHLALAMPKRSATPAQRAAIAKALRPAAPAGAATWSRRTTSRAGPANASTATRSSHEPPHRTPQHWPPDYGTVYLLHFDRPSRHAAHYTGWAANLDQRLSEHASGRGAHLLAVAQQAGIGWSLARTWPGIRTRERALKNQGGASRCCPICRRGTAHTRGRFGSRHGGA
jgi:predicted GIY-YIG superfamily endonuclease